MKKLIAILLASSVVAMPVAAFAQAATTPVDPGVGISAGAGASAGAAGGASTSTPSAGQYAWTDLMSSLNVSASGTAGADMGTMISGIAAGSNVQIIDITSLEGAPADAGSQIQAALSTNGTAMTDLHTAINANAFLVQQLEAGGHSVDDVVAVSAAADGGFLLYVQPAADVTTLPAPAAGDAPAAGAAAPAAPAAGY